MLARFCFSKEEIKTAIAEGDIAIADRDTGKSEAILEHVHEHHHGHAIIVSLNPITAHCNKVRYATQYPGDRNPIMLNAGSPGWYHTLRGHDLPVYVDELSGEHLAEMRNVVRPERIAGGATSAY